MSEWQPIETAPKDGTFILVIEDDWSDVCQWLDNWKVTGWVSRGDQHDDHASCNPTHWMPLPEPPKCS